MLKWSAFILTIVLCIHARFYLSGGEGGGGGKGGEGLRGADLEFDLHASNMNWDRRHIFK